MNPLTELALSLLSLMNFQKVYREGNPICQTTVLPLGMSLICLDFFLHSIITSFPGSPNYTLIYASSPSSHVKSHKRSAVILTQDDNANVTEGNGGGLFQQYQFFTPAIYMGFIQKLTRSHCSLMAAVVLVPTLLIAVKVVGSLKISPFEAPKTHGTKKTQ